MSGPCHTGDTHASGVHTPGLLSRMQAAAAAPLLGKPRAGREAGPLGRQWGTHFAALVSCACRTTCSTASICSSPRTSCWCTSGGSTPDDPGGPGMEATAQGSCRSASTSALASAIRAPWRRDDAPCEVRVRGEAGSAVRRGRRVEGRQQQCPSASARAGTRRDNLLQRRPDELLRQVDGTHGGGSQNPPPSDKRSVGPELLRRILPRWR